MSLPLATSPHLIVTCHTSSPVGPNSRQTSTASMNSCNVSFLSSINQFHEFIWIMRSTITAPCRSHQKAEIDAKAAPAPSSLPSRRCSPSKKDKHGGEAAIPSSIPSIMLAAMNAANAAAVAVANPWRSIKFPLAPIPKQHLYHHPCPPSAIAPARRTNTGEKPPYHHPSPPSG
jgi:hypothetical protein